MLPDPRPYFAELAEPRRATKNKLHPLQAIRMIGFCAVLSGIEDWVGMERFARAKEAWLRQFLELPHGIPSHDTWSDVMGRLGPGVFAEAFLRWAQSALPGLVGEQSGLDGQALRGSRGADGAVHLLSAWAAKARLVLAQQAVDGQANEITASPPVWDRRALHGAVVSIDAMGCQQAIAEQISPGGADYVLALKDNHPPLREDVGLGLDTAAGKGAWAGHETLDKDPGRSELRRYVLSDDLPWLGPTKDWAGWPAVGRGESTRILGSQTTTAHRYYLSSRTSLERFADVVRNHWAIEHGQHWVLAVQFGEDANRARKDPSAANLALVRRMALNVIRHNGPSQESLRIRKLRASLNEDYRFDLLFGKPST